MVNLSSIYTCWTFVCLPCIKYLINSCVYILCVCKRSWRQLSHVLSILFSEVRSLIEPRIHKNWDYRHSSTQSTFSPWFPRFLCLHKKTLYKLIHLLNHLNFIKCAVCKGSPLHSIVSLVVLSLYSAETFLLGKTTLDLVLFLVTLGSSPQTPCCA